MLISNHKLKYNLLGLVMMFYCCSHTFKGSGSQAPSHDLWTTILQKHVSDKGWVNYQSFQTDLSDLNTYLDLLSKNPPDANTWNKHEQMAYWINAYNAFTIKLILDHYPVKSINDIGPAFQIPFFNSVFDIKFFTIGKIKMSLNKIEHGQLRAKFNEPRIHFALNCASVSCPPLRKEAYHAEKLDAQLNEQAGIFLADPTRNKIKKDHIQISKIFKWFKSDFTKNGSLIEFLNRYSKVQINKNADIDFLDYNWNLNEQWVSNLY